MLNLNEYIARINDNDTTLDCIELINTQYNNDDAERLMQALSNNPECARRITTIRITYCAQLTNLNISAELTALKYLQLRANKLTSLNIPGTLTALNSIVLDHNNLIDFNIPRTLTSLTHVWVANNKLASVNIPSTLVSLENLDLSGNLLESINIPSTLVSLEKISLTANNLERIKIPATLRALNELTLGNNGLVDVMLPLTLKDLRIVTLEGNYSLSTISKLGVACFRMSHMMTTIVGVEDVELQLTPELLCEYFEATKPVFSSTINSSLFKHAVMQAGQRLHKTSLPSELIMMAMNWANIGPEAMLNQHVIALQNVFSPYELKTDVLNNFLSSSYMEEIKREVKNLQKTAIESISYKFRKNLKQASNNVNRKIKMLESVLNYGGAPAIAWRHEPSYGLTDNTPIESARNPFQLALKPSM